MSSSKSNHVQQKRRKEEDSLEDRISTLPDDIIIHLILRNLTLKEAAIAGVLSKRWWYLWTQTPHLDFDSYANFSIPSVCPYVAGDSHKLKYVNWVSQVLKQHRGPLEGFRVCFDLDYSFAPEIDAWVEYGFSKRIQRFELDLRCHKSSLEKYNFPNIFAFVQFSGFKSLRELSLGHLNVDDEMFNCFISTFPLLEHLRITAAHTLRNVQVSGAYLKLKSLEFYECYGMKSIKISDTSIAKLAYRGYVSLSLSNCHQLVELFVGFPIPANYSKILSLSTQLEILTLDYLFMKTIVPQISPTWSRLKQLTINVLARYNKSYLDLLYLIKASPYLQKFVLKMSWTTPKLEQRMIKAIELPHYHLKVVELAGYYGQPSDFEFAMYFIENAVALEKIIIDPRDAGQFYNDEKARRIGALKPRKRAKEQLEGKVPSRISLLIL